jgi:hypothetical protein
MEVTPRLSALVFVEAVLFFSRLHRRDLMSRPMQWSYGDDARSASHENAPAITFLVKCL